MHYHDTTHRKLAPPLHQTITRIVSVCWLLIKGLFLLCCIILFWEIGKATLKTDATITSIERYLAHRDPGYTDFVAKEAAKTGAHNPPKHDFILEKFQQ